MKSLMVTHGHQGSTWGCLVYQHDFMDFYCQKIRMRSTGRGQSVYIKEKKISQPARSTSPSSSSCLGPSMFFIHFLMTPLEPNTHTLSKRAFA